jgi:O-antigen/teichoic acid export membrane protein
MGRGTAVTWIAWIASRALTLATLILLARALPAEDLGALLAAVAMGTLGSALAMGGLPDATTRNAVSSVDATQFGRGDLEVALRRFGAALPVILVLLIVMTSNTPGANKVELVAAGLLLAVTQGGTGIVASVFRARGQAGRYALATSLLAAIGRAAVAVVALALDADSSVVLWTFVLINAGVIAITWRGAVVGLPDTTSKSEGLGALHLGGTLWSLMWNLDVVVVGLLLGTDEAGVYGVALRIAEFSLQFWLALGVLYLPEATKLAVSGGLDGLRSVYRAACRWSTLVIVLVAGVGFVAAPALAELIYPDDAGTVTTLLRLLFAGYGFQGALGPAYSTLIAAGAYRRIGTASAVLIPATLIATFALTALFGVVGAASATLGTYVIAGTWWVVVVSRDLAAPAFDRLYVRALMTLAGALAVATVAFRATEDSTALLSLLASGVAGLTAWAGLMLLLRPLTETELRLVARLTRGRAIPREPSADAG